MGDLSLFLHRLTLFHIINRGPGTERHVVVADLLREHIHIVVFIKIIGLGSFAEAYWRIVWLIYCSPLILLLSLSLVVPVLLLLVSEYYAWLRC